MTSDTYIDTLIVYFAKVRIDENRIKAVMNRVSMTVVSLCIVSEIRENVGLKVKRVSGVDIVEKGPTPSHARYYLDGYRLM